MRMLRLGLLSIAFVAGPLLINACSGSIQSTDAADDSASTDPARSPPAAPTKTPGTPEPPDPSPSPQPPPPPVTPADSGTVATDAAVSDDGSTTTDAGTKADADDDASTEGGPPMTCAASATFDACIDCCDSKNPGGFDVGDAAWLNCICKTPGVCAAACGSSLCSPAGADPSAACITCLDSQPAAQCDTVADNACKASASCQAAEQCVTASNCEAKP